MAADAPRPTSSARPPRLGQIAFTAGTAVLRATQRVSPTPTVAVIRRIFAAGGRHTAAVLDRGAPSSVRAVADVPYGRSPDERVDLYTPPTDAEWPGDGWPLVVWIHGGGFVGGTKEELGGWARRLAAAGYAVALPRYGLAPTTSYPRALRQVADAVDRAASLGRSEGIDPTRIVLAGDSAGANLAAQLALVVSEPAYARAVGVGAPIDRSALRGVVLCCGVYDLPGLEVPPALRPYLDAVGWAYSGRRDFRAAQPFADQTVLARHVTGSFPPAFVTAGDADPLEPQSRRLVEALDDAGVEVDERFFDDIPPPGFGHECQFELGVPAARETLDRILGFLGRCTAP